MLEYRFSRSCRYSRPLDKEAESLAQQISRDIGRSPLTYVGPYDRSVKLRRMHQQIYEWEWEEIIEERRMEDQWLAAKPVSYLYVDCATWAS